MNLPDEWNRQRQNDDIGEDIQCCAGIEEAINVKAFPLAGRDRLIPEVTNRMADIDGRYECAEGPQSNPHGDVFGYGDKLAHGEDALIEKQD